MPIVVASPFVLIYCVALLLNGEKSTCEAFDPNDQVDEASEIDTSAAKIAFGLNTKKRVKKQRRMRKYESFIEKIFPKV